MATRRLGIIMHGVTGRMGTNQHLVRSILAIRADGGVRLAERRRGHARSDPRRPERRQARGAGEAPQRRALDDRPRRRARRSEGRNLLRRRHDADAPGARPAGDRGRQAHLLRKAERDEPRRCALDRAARRGARREERRRAGQAFPAGTAEAEDAARFRLLRTHALGARRVRLLGVRGRSAADAAPLVELPRRGRRRHHPRYALPLALRARPRLRRGARASPASARRTSPSAGTRTGKPYEATAEDAAYATFMLEGGVVAQINSSWQTRVYRDDLVTFQVDGTHGSAVAGLQSCKIQQRMATPRPVWNPDEKRADDFRAGWQDVPDTRALSERLSPRSGRCSSATSSPMRRGITRCSKARRACSSPSWRWRAGSSARWIDVPPLSLAGERAAREGSRPCRLTPRRCASRRRVELRLPTADRGLATLSHGRAEPLSCHRAAAPSTASPSPPRMSSPIRSPSTIRGSPRRSTGTRRSPIAATSGGSASPSPRRWTRRSAAWGSTGRTRSS